jgi:hypothetical protein
VVGDLALGQLGLGPVALRGLGQRHGRYLAQVLQERFSRRSAQPPPLFAAKLKSAGDV